MKLDEHVHSRAVYPGATSHVLAQHSGALRRNQKFLQKWGPVSRRLHNAVLRFQDRKTHRYFKCPNCHKRLRVPKAAADHDHLPALPHAVCPEKLKKTVDCTDKKTVS